MYFIDVTDRDTWDSFVANRPETNFLQSWDFYEFHKSRGLEVVRRALIDDSSKTADYPKATNPTKTTSSAKSTTPRILAAYAGVVEHAKRGRHLAIAGGPILDWNDQRPVEIASETASSELETYPSLAAAVIADIKSQAKKLNCVFARLRPQCELSDETLQLAKDLGLKRAPMYLSVEYAGVLDLTKTDAEIEQGMRQRLRRALRKGAKNGIAVEVSTNPKDIHEFYQIQLQTAKRHDFYAFGESFLTKQFSAFARQDNTMLSSDVNSAEPANKNAKASAEPADKNAKTSTASLHFDPHGEARLYIAKKDGEILAENFMIFYGTEASYHYGVSSELGTKLSGAPLLHVQAMKDARAKGLTRYSLWGIVAEDDVKHRFYGVSQFKRGFGVTELKYLPAHDLVLKPLPYLKTWLIETIRRKIRRV